MKKKIWQIIFSVLALLVIALPSALSQEFSGRVVGVSDGDTITVLTDGAPRKVRLSGIDCPEKSQAFGRQAKEFTSSHVFSRQVKVISLGQDRYGRTIGEVILPSGENLSDLLLSNGYAWWYQKYSTDEHRHDLEENARRLKLGLWTDQQAIAPWDYRKIAKSYSSARRSFGSPSLFLPAQPVNQINPDRRTGLMNPTNRF